MKRRSFVAGAAAWTAAGWFGAGAARAWAASGDTRYDLIVIGAGTAGIPAAIFAAARGAPISALRQGCRRVTLHALPMVGG